MDDLDLGATIKGFSAGQKVFNRYQLKRILGRGGMGVVWLAQDGELEREVALKFLPEIVALDPEALADLKRETRRNLDLTHPHIVRIYDFVADSRTAAISMEYVNGASLSALKLDQPGRVFATEEIRGWLGQLTEALTYAHTKAKVVHRDLKPANLMLTKDGDLKITDFGIARGISDSVSRVSAQAGGSSGTPVYMSPQQMMGEKPAVTDDIYALGATLYELLTGKPPFYSGNVFMQVQSKLPPTIAERRQELEVTGDTVPEHWEQTIAACLAKEPAARPQSMVQVAQRLGLSGGPVPAPEPVPLQLKPVVDSRVAPVAVQPPRLTAPEPSWFRRWVLVPAGWGFLVSMPLAVVALFFAPDSVSENPEGAALVYFMFLWPCTSFVVSCFMGARRAHREEVARLAADPNLMLVPVLRRWLLAPVAATLPVALVISGLAYGLNLDAEAGLYSFLVCWPLLSGLAFLLLAARRPWGVRSPWGIATLGAVLIAPVGEFATMGEVGSSTNWLCIFAAGYLGGLGGWLMHRLAVWLPVTGVPQAQAQEKRLGLLLCLVGAAAALVFFILLPASVAGIKAERQAAAAQAEAARIELERIAQEQAREQRRAEAPGLITAAVKMVFNRSPTPTELDDYTTKLVENPAWNAAGLRQELRESPAGRKGGRLLVPTEFPTIREAISAAVPGNAIHVAAGTYAESIYLDKAISLIGAGRDQVTLATDCTRNALRVVNVTGVTISGFTFRHTDTNELGNRASLVSFSGSSVRFAGNALRQANGMGMWIAGSGSSTVVDNIIHGGRWSGINVDEKGSAEIRNNEITANQSSAITVSDSAGKVSIIGNEVRQSGLNGIWVAGGESVTLIDNRLSGNSAAKENYGGIGIGGGRPVLRGNVSLENKGAGIWWDPEKAQPRIGPGNFSDGQELPISN